MSTDLREGGRWSPAQRLKNDALWTAACVALALTERLPHRWLVRLGELVGVGAHRALPAVRRQAERNVGAAFPDLAPSAVRQLVARTYRTLGRQLGEAVATLDPRSAPALLPLAEGSRACLDRAMSSGRGVVLAAAHLGPWERVATSLIAHGVPLTAVAREAYDPRLTTLYDRLRGDRGVPIIYRGRPGAAARLLRTLRRGGVLGIPMDLASRVPSVEVPFLGRAAPTPVGPARLALRAGAAVVVATVAEHAAGLTLLISPVPSEDLLPDAHGERALTARINEELGARIRAMPHGWVWMHPRWPSTADPASRSSTTTASPKGTLFP